MDPPEKIIRIRVCYPILFGDNIEMKE